MELIQHDGPVYIHCTAGKDRTGFVCMALEALAGASYQQIGDDYIITYDNYCTIRERPRAREPRHEALGGKQGLKREGGVLPVVPRSVHKARRRLLTPGHSVWHT